MKPGLRLFCSKLNCDNFSRYDNLCLPFCKTILESLGYWSLLAWPCFGFKMTACTEKSSIYRIHAFFPKGGFLVSGNFYVRTWAKLPLGNKIEAMYERSLASVKVEPRWTSRLSSALFILHLFYLRDYNLRALTCVAENASVKINFKADWFALVFACIITWQSRAIHPTKHKTKLKLLGN